MDAREAEAFLATSWGSAAGDRERRFFSEMVRLYLPISPYISLYLPISPYIFSEMVHFHCSGDEPTRTSSSPSPSP